MSLSRSASDSRGAAEQSLAADGAIACFSSNLFPLSLDADRAPQLKASVRLLPLACGIKMMTVALDRVYTVTDYCDGPRAGVANFSGQPHYYECQFDELKDDWSDIFTLKPIDSETFRLALEDWDIWERWNAAREDGKVDLDTHPALPEERERHDEISLILQERLKADPETDIKAKGQFDVVEPKRKGQSIVNLVVKWSVIPLAAI